MPQARAVINLLLFAFFLSGVPLASASACGFAEAPGDCGASSESEARYMLQRVTAAVKADKVKALAEFNAGQNGFRTQDTYVFCVGPDGVMTAHPSTIIRCGTGTIQRATTSSPRCSKRLNPTAFSLSATCSLGRAALWPCRKRLTTSGQTTRFAASACMTTIGPSSQPNSRANSRWRAFALASVPECRQLWRAIGSRIRT